MAARTLIAFLLLTLAIDGVARADDPVIVAPKPRDAMATIDAVTLYQGRAAVTRTAKQSLEPGVWEMRFDDLPATVVVDSLQATVSAPATLLDVRYEETTLPSSLSSDPAILAAQKELDVLRKSTLEVDAKRQTLKTSLALLDGMALKIADTGGKSLGTDAIDPAKLKAQIEAIAAQRDEISKSMLALDEESRGFDERRTALAAKVAAAGSATRTQRTGFVVLAMSANAAPVDIALTYLVSNATWQPTYSIRAASDLSGLQVDYDATIFQRTGESWKDVRLTLSTAQPTHAAAPAVMEPIFVDTEYATKSAETFAVGRSASVPPPPKVAPASSMDDRESAAEAQKPAQVRQNGVAATFTLTRAVSLASDMQREQKTRIASFELAPTYTYVTRPAVDPQAYLRGTCRNDTEYQLLSGIARVFLGGDSVGVTMLPDVAPGTDVELWFGADKRISVERKLIAKNTSTSGLLSRYDDIVWQWGIDLRSTLSTQASMEVWDRVPVSRDEDITVKLSDVSPALATDKKYEANEKTQGFLKWSLNLPARAEDKPPTLVSIRWTTKLTKPEKTPISPLPE